LRPILLDLKLSKALAIMDLVGKTFSIIGQSYMYMILFGGAAGAGFELFKIKFAMNGISFYSVFKRNQLKRELGRFEAELKATEAFIKEQYQQESKAPS